MNKTTRIAGTLFFVIAIGLMLAGCGLVSAAFRGVQTESPLVTATMPADSATLPPALTPTPTLHPTVTPSPTPTLHPLSIQAMRAGNYPGSDLQIEEKLPSGSNFEQMIVSYRSQGLKIYALMTVPFGDPPPTGWPVIIFNHGYIPPKEYRTTERYVGYVNGFARNGYIVLKPDYRGHGNSEGRAGGAYSSPDYTIDVLNALASIQRYPLADAQNIGMWGHSMGGHITLRAMVTSKAIKAGVIWAGVVGSYSDMMYNWHATPPASLSSSAHSWQHVFVDLYGDPATNPTFWASISPITFVADLSGPLQIHHGEDDKEVPIAFSESLYEAVKAAGKEVEFYTYPGTDHNLSQSFSTAMQRSVEFFDRYLKTPTP